MSDSFFVFSASSSSILILSSLSLSFLKLACTDLYFSISRLQLLERSSIFSLNPLTTTWFLLMSSNSSVVSFSEEQFLMVLTISATSSKASFKQVATDDEIFSFAGLHLPSSLREGGTNSIIVGTQPCFSPEILMMLRMDCTSWWTQLSYGILRSIQRRFFWQMMLCRNCLSRPSLVFRSLNITSKVLEGVIVVLSCQNFLFSSDNTFYHPLSIFFSFVASMNASLHTSMHSAISSQTVSMILLRIRLCSEGRQAGFWLWGLLRRLRSLMQASCPFIMPSSSKKVLLRLPMCEVMFFLPWKELCEDSRVLTSFFMWLVEYLSDIWLQQPVQNMSNVFVLAGAQLGDDEFSEDSRLRMSPEVHQGQKGQI